MEHHINKQRDPHVSLFVKGAAVILLPAMLLLLSCSLANAGSVLNTLHNLSISGPGQIKSTTEKQVCIFCHTPHDAEPHTPLWNKKLNKGTNYNMYWSNSLESLSPGGKPVTPDGASKLCLSCHDGTIAIGEVRSRRSPIPMQNNITTMPSTSRGYLGTNLSGSHPISFVVTQKMITQSYVTGSNLASMTEMKDDPDGVRLDSNNEVQCISCHNPHQDDNFSASGVHFLRKSNITQVCIICHKM